MYQSSNSTLANSNEQDKAKETRAYSIEEFCRVYSIGRSTLYSECKKGNISLRKIGSRSIILASEAERWAASLPEAVK